MKAYAILCGGGVKGAALAGCLAAAEQQGVEFMGYGGASAGSIVAVLAAAGFTGAELRQIVTKDLDFASLLDDQGADLRRLRRSFEFLASTKLITKITSPLKTVEALKVVRHLKENLGLYDGGKVAAFLTQRLREKHPELTDHAEISFDALHKLHSCELKIAAADLTRRRVAVFCRDQARRSNDGWYGGSVARAVRASIGYPFVFKPSQLDNCRLSDGGLCSNLPVYLFSEEIRRTRIPILAFDLIPVSRVRPDPYHADSMIRDLLATVLESSDNILRDLVPGASMFRSVSTATSIRWIST